jgi:hypothetical protein
MWKCNLIIWCDNISHSNPSGSSADSLDPATFDTTTLALAIEITNVGFTASLQNCHSEYSKWMDAEVKMLVKPLTTTPSFWYIRKKKMSILNKQIHWKNKFKKMILSRYLEFQQRCIHNCSTQLVYLIPQCDIYKGVH